MKNTVRYNIIHKGDEYYDIKDINKQLNNLLKPKFDKESQTWLGTKILAIQIDQWAIEIIYQYLKIKYP